MDICIKIFALFVGINAVSAISYVYMDVQCGQTVNVYDNMRLRLTASSTYSPNMDCSLVLKASGLSSRLMFFFKSFNIESTILSCTNDWLDLKDGSSSSSSYISGLNGHQCGSYKSSSTVYTTSGRSLYLRFHSDSSLQYSGFDIVITSFHTGFCYSYEYNCGNGRCISDSLTCDGYNPCGDYSDCGVGVVIAAGGIAGIVVGAIFFIVVVTIVVIVCRRRRVGYVGGSIQAPTVNVVTSSGGYSQPVPAQYPAPAYPTGQQYPQNYQNQPQF